MAAEKRLAFQLGAGLATQVLTEAQFVKAGYIVVKTLADREALVTADQEVLIAGSPVYVSDEKKTYRFVPNADGHTGTWVDDQASSGTFVFRGEVTYKEDLPADPLEGDIYKVLKIKGTGTEPDYEDGHNYFAHYYVDATSGSTVHEWRLMSGIDADSYVNDLPTTVKVGGLEKGTTFEEAEGWNLKKILDAMLYPYVAFTFEGITTADACKTYEYGTSVNITKVTPSYTIGSKPMTSIKVGTTDGGSDLLDSATVPATGNAATLTNPLAASTADATIYVTLTDGTTTLKKSGSVKFEKPIYYAHQLSDTDIPTSGSKGNNVNIVVAQNEFVLFLAPDKTKTQIQQFANGEWNNVDTTYMGEQTAFTLASGAVVTYQAYRTNKLNASTYQFRLN